MEAAFGPLFFCSPHTCVRTAITRRLPRHPAIARRLTWRAAHPHTASPPDASSHAHARGFAASHANPPFSTRDDHDQPGRGRVTTHFIDLRDNLPV
ncbi:hypothetical protein AQ765_18150 [Burkholderia pseudomallei]|nr:hypothetical protein A7U58_12990 [Burkholderia pseudomallei]ANW56903.1 hypothetical protein A7U59_12965 [Burkholderia pseudomallei]APD36376.1 hypothetical protein BK015_15365 [Burkholderia pseudomallei]ARK40129.1 hypothetical protein BOC60_07770 [Burkholderia pseudomallei]KKI76773.1 hypothetical protein VU09_04825 [Burkholderia pseudomallei]